MKCWSFLELQCSNFGCPYFFKIFHNCAQFQLDRRNLISTFYVVKFRVKKVNKKFQKFNDSNLIETLQGSSKYMKSYWQPKFQGWNLKYGRVFHTCKFNAKWRSLRWFERRCSRPCCNIFLILSNFLVNRILIGYPLSSWLQLFLHFKLLTTYPLFTGNFQCMDSKDPFLMFGIQI